jgi:hypothetical protein
MQQSTSLPLNTLKNNGLPHSKFHYIGHYKKIVGPKYHNCCEIRKPIDTTKAL